MAFHDRINKVNHCSPNHQHVHVYAGGDYKNCTVDPKFYSPFNLEGSIGSGMSVWGLRNHWERRGAIRGKDDGGVEIACMGTINAWTRCLVTTSFGFPFCYISIIMLHCSNERPCQGINGRRVDG